MINLDKERSAPPILEYGNSETSFDRFTGFLQDSISFSDQLVLSVGAKFEDSDITGSSFQPGTRLSYSFDNQNIIWGAYSHAHRQPSLVEKFTDVSYGRVFVAPGVAFQLVSPANTALVLDDTAVIAYILPFVESPKSKDVPPD